MLKHIGYLHGVTDRPPQCPSFCHVDEYHYYYDLGRRILRGTGGSFFQEPAMHGGLIESEQSERRIAA